MYSCSALHSTDVPSFMELTVTSSMTSRTARDIARLKKAAMWLFSCASALQQVKIDRGRKRGKEEEREGGRGGGRGEHQLVILSKGSFYTVTAGAHFTLCIWWFGWSLSHYKWTSIKESDHKNRLWIAIVTVGGTPCLFTKCDVRNLTHYISMQLFLSNWSYLGVEQCLPQML